MIVDYQKILDLKERLYLHDECIFVKDVIQLPEQFASWDEVIEVAKDLGTYAALTIPKKRTEDDYQGAAFWKKENPEKKDELDKKYDAMHRLKNNQDSIVVLNWERKNRASRELLARLLNIFHIDFDQHGVWPAEISSRSGHVHMYCGFKESNSFPPHCDYPNNIIFQIDGKSRWTTYKNRVSTLVDKETIVKGLSAKERQEKVFDTLEIDEVHIAEPGDMIYIPARVYHRVEPITDRISISFPLQLIGPWAASP